MEIKEILKNTGLTDSEAKVYLSLLRIGSSLASEIAKRCGLHRTNVYDSLNKLIDKGLVSFVIRENRKYFLTENPEKLLELMKQREEEIKAILSDLKRNKEATEEKVDVQIYRGKEGYKAVMGDAIKSGAKEWLLLGMTGKGLKISPYYLPSLFKLTNKLKIKIKGISTSTKEALDSIKMQPNLQVRFFPKQIKNITYLHIYANKVIMIPITPNIEKEPIIFLLNNKETADSFRDYFRWMWKEAKEKPQE
jgi:sugar-specific transcriptional regulator TrmB